MNLKKKYIYIFIFLYYIYICVILILNIYIYIYISTPETCSHNGSKDRVRIPDPCSYPTTITGERCSRSGRHVCIPETCSYSGSMFVFWKHARPKEVYTPRDPIYQQN